MAATQRYLPIEDYAVIGDCHTAALVSSTGSIDWYCPGRFDNPAVFCRILDAQSGGFLKIDCGCNEGISRKYLEHTNILMTNVSCDNTKLQIIQFMPVRSRDLNYREEDVKTPFRIITSIEALSAYAEIRLAFKPTFNFAREECQFSNVPNGVIASWVTHHLVLFAQGMKFHITQEGVAEGIRKLKKGEKLWIILDYSKSEKSIQITFTDNECEYWFKETLSYWDKWVERCTYRGAFRNEVVRSALVLKLLTYESLCAGQLLIEESLFKALEKRNFKILQPINTDDIHIEILGELISVQVFERAKRKARKPKPEEKKRKKWFQIH